MPGTCVVEQNTLKTRVWRASVLMRESKKELSTSSHLPGRTVVHGGDHGECSSCNSYLAYHESMA